jgi:hypothetical protein
VTHRTKWKYFETYSNKLSALLQHPKLSASGTTWLCDRYEPNQTRVSQQKITEKQIKKY